MINFMVTLETSTEGIQHDDRHIENTDMLAMTVTIVLQLLTLGVFPCWGDYE